MKWRSGGVFGLPFFLLHVLGGWHTEQFLELDGEGRDVGEPDLLRHLGDGAFLLCQNLGCLGEADILDEFGGRLVGELLHFPIQVYATHTRLIGHHLDGEFRVADVLVHHADDAFHHAFVGRLGLGHVNLVRWHLQAREVVAEAVAVLEQVIDRALENLGDEGFGDEGVGSQFEALQMRLLRGLGGEHHDGDMVEAHVLPHFPTQFHAVHDGHHQVGDDEVGHLPDDVGQRFTPIAEGRDFAAVGKLPLQQVADVLVVLDDDDAFVAERGIEGVFGVRQESVGRKTLERWRVDAGGEVARLGQFVGGEVALAQREDDLDAGAWSLGIVGHADGAVVQSDERGGEVQANACSHAAGIGAELIEALEDVPFRLVGDALARIGHREGERSFGIFFAGGQNAETHFDGAAGGGVLDGVGEEVDNHFVEVGCVNPDGEVRARLVHHLQVQVLHLDEVVGGLAHIVHVLGDRHLAEAELHLVLVDAAQVHELVDESDDAVGITVHHFVRLVPFGVVVVFRQFLQW